SPATNTKFWTDILTAKDPDKGRSIALEMNYGCVLLENYVPKIIDLLRRPKEERPIVVAEGGKKGKQKMIATQTLTFLIREFETSNLPVDQFAHVLNATQNLYNVILKVNN